MMGKEDGKSGRNEIPTVVDLHGRCRATGGFTDGAGNESPVKTVCQNKTADGCQEIDKDIHSRLIPGLQSSIIVRPQVIYHITSSFASKDQSAANLFPKDVRTSGSVALIRAPTQSAFLVDLLLSWCSFYRLAHDKQETTSIAFRKSFGE